MFDYNSKSNNGVVDFGKIICFDFDGVIAKFEGWKGADVFGEPIDGAVEIINKLKEEGWYICIFTSRLVTIKLYLYLMVNKIPYDDINGRKNDKDNLILQSYHSSPVIEYESNFGNIYWKHNPPFSSIKPVASIYVDDMDWRQNGKNFTKKEWKELYRTIKSREQRKIQLRYKVSTFVNKTVYRRFIKFFSEL